MIRQYVSPRIRSAVKAFSSIVFIALLLGISSGAFAQGPHIYLDSAKKYPVLHVSNGGDVRDLRAEGATPLSLAAGDFNEDGYGDLVAGYSLPGGKGAISLHLGNPNAFAPQDDESFRAIAHSNFPAPYLPNAIVLDVPVAPDFIAVGDFNGDSHLDLAVAAKGGALYIIPGTGKGKFGNPILVSLPGGVTALAAGEFGNTNSRLIVGAGSQLLVFGGTTDALEPLVIYNLDAPATQVAFGWNLSGLGTTDAAVVIGNQVGILAGGSLQLQILSLPVSVSQLAVGNFVPNRSEGSQMALLAADGSVSIAVHSSFDPRPLSPEEFRAIRKARREGKPNPIVPAVGSNEGWIIAETIQSGAPTNSASQPLMFETRVSDRPTNDLMILDPAAGGLVVVLRDKTQQGAATFTPAQLTVLPYYGTPVAALPLRVNIDGRPGVVVLNQGEIAANVMMPLPDPTFTVNRTDDPAPASPITNACNGAANDCSLREAILRANATAGTDTVMVPAGTYTLTIARVSNDCTGNFGALSVDDSINIIGAGQNTTIIQAGTTAYNAGTPNGVDMVMNVNEDLGTANCPLTNATASISNLTLQNGHNLGTVGNFDGDGGCMEFDTGNAATANLTLDHVTLQNCNTTDGNGGGIAMFNTNNGTGLATITNSIFQNNSAKQVTGGATGTGGGIWVADPARMSMSLSQVLNNLATNSGGANAGSGGGITITSNVTGSRQTQIHASAILGNQAAGIGGGINTTANLVIDQDSIISSNSAGTANITNLKDGGGLFINTGNPDSVSITKTTITNNHAANGNGGGISDGSPGGTHGTLNMTFSRLAGNTVGGSGSNLNNNDGTVTATDDWWGTNLPATTINNITSTATFDPFIVLSNTPSPNPIKLGQTTTLTASFLQDNHGIPIAVSNLDVLLGLPLTFGNPIDGTLSNSEAAVQPVSVSTATESGSTVTITTSIAHGYVPGETVVIAGVGVAGYNGTFTVASTPTTTTFTYTNGTTGLGNSGGGTAGVGASGTATSTFQSTLAGTGHADATVDQGTGTANITIQKGDTTATLTSSVNPSVFGQSVTFTATVSPVAPAGPPTTAAPTGTVTFLDGGSPIGTGTVNSVTGIATFTTSALAVGNHTITASYGGDSNYNGSTASLTGNPQVVNKADTTTTVTSSANPSVFGQSVTFTATVSAVAPGAGTATGTVTFLDGGSPIGTGTLSGGVATFSTSALTVGNHTITTNYGGDGNFNGSTGSLTGNPQVVNKADTSTTVTSSANPSVFGQSVTFTATVSPVAPGAGTPVGTVTFLDGGSPIGTGTLSGGVATFSTSALTVGNHTITTNYGGDGNFNGSTGSLTGNPQVVNKANTATTVTSSVNPSVFGQSVTFTATVSPVAPGAGTPVGTVTFLDGGSPIGTGTLSGGIATFTTSALTVGNHTITTNYGGDGNFNGSTGSLTGNPQVVNKANTTTTTTSSVNPSVFGQSVTFTSTVSPVAPGAGTPVGTVTFLDGGSPIGTGTLSGGIATFTTSALTAGNHTITTNYGGDGNFNGSTSSLTGNPQVVNKANTTTTVTSSVNPSVFGQSVTFTATVSAVAPGSGTATGTVTFLDGGSPIGTGTLSGGIATFTTSALTIGNHTITTSYGGDGNFNGSTGSLTGNPQVVNKANTATTVTSSVNPSVFGQSVTFTATVSAVAPGSGTATGTVTFLDGGSPIGTGTLSGGIATFTTSALTVGNHTITTSYGGDGNFNGSAGSLTGNPQVVNKADTSTTVTSSVNPSVFGQSVTFTATVSAVAPGSGTATGTVTFLDGGSPIGTGTLSGGIATFTTSALAVGNHTITTSYGGDGNFNGSTGSLTGNPQVVNKADTTTTVTSSVNPSVFGQSVTFTATVSPVAPGAGTPTGTVTFLDGGSPIGTGTLSGGIATFATSALTAGNHTITTSYGGDGNFNGSTGSLTGNPQVVNKADTTTTVTSSANPSVFGQSVTFTATVSPVAPGAGTPTGTVTFLDGGSPIGTGTLSGGIATFTTSALTIGNHTITTSYGGDGNFNGSTGSLTGNPQVVNKANTTTTVTSSVNPSVFGQSVTFTATVSAVAPGSGTPTGTVTFLDGGSPIGTGTLSGGIATFTTSALTVGNHTITTSYGGDGNFNGSTGSLTGNPQVVNKANTTTTVTSSLNPSRVGQSVTFTATVSVVAPGSGTPTGTVSFLDGGSPIGTGTLSGGVATFATSALAAGNHTITTSYGGDGNFNGSTGSLTGNPQVVIGPPSIAKAFNPTTIALNATTSLTFTITNPSANTVALTGVGFTDTLPTGLTVPNASATVCGGTVTLTAPTGISLSGATIAASSQCVFSITVTGAASGIYTNTTGAVSSTNGGTGNTATANLTVASAPTINKAFGVSSITQNATTSLTFNIANPNSGLALSGVAFTDSLPSGLIVATPNGLSSNCGGTATATAGSGSVSLSAGTLTAGGSCTISLNVQGTTAGVKSNTTGAISSTQSGTGATSNTVTLTVIGAPTISKVFGAASIPVNGTTSLTFTLTNPNSTTTVTGIAFTDTLPSGLLVANPNGLTGSCGGGTITAAANSGSVSLSGASLAASTNCTFAVNVTGTAGGAKTNTTSTVATTNAGTGAAATASIAVVAPPSIAKAFSPASISPNTVSTITFTLTNPSANSVAEAGVAFTDTLPANLIVATPNGAVNNCTGTLTAVAGSGSISLTGASIAVASSCTVKVNVTSATPGTYTNTTGAVSSTNGGTGNTATAQLFVAPANLTITKTHASNFPRGGTGTYTITVSNSAGAGPTTGQVTVVDTLPNVTNPFTVQSASGTGWGTCTISPAAVTPTTVTCKRSDVLAANASYPAITLTVNVPINIQADVTNSVTVSGGGDPNSHTANDPTHIGPPIDVEPHDPSVTQLTIPAGQNAGVLLDVLVSGSQTVTGITFTCSNLPAYMRCRFDQQFINAPGQTMLTIITDGRHSPSSPQLTSVEPLFGGTSKMAYAGLLLPLLGLGGLGIASRKSRKARLRLLVILGGLMLLISFAGCGTSGFPAASTPAGTYPITINSSGTSGATTVTSTNTLTVQVTP